MIFLWYQAGSICSTKISSVDAGGAGEGHTSLLDSQKLITLLRHPFSEQDQKPLHAPFLDKKERVCGIREQ